MVSEVNFELIYDEMSERIIEAAAELVTTSGAHTLTVREVLNKLGITNRVFYNRFKNIDEVLKILYKNTVLRMRETIVLESTNKEEFFEYVINVLSDILVKSYDIKMQFNHYVFEHDSLSESNYKWWMAEIKKLIEYAKEKRFIKDVDSDVLSYSIWCFCRGYNADAVGRNIPKEEAVRQFKYSFSFLLDGLKLD